MRIGVRAEPVHLLGVLDEGKHAAGRGRTRRVVPRRGDDHVVAVALVLGQPVPVEARVGDHRRHVVGRVFPPLPAELREVVLEVPDHVDQRRRLEGALHVRVRRAEHLLRQLQHQRLVALRDPQDRHDHAQRIPHRDVLEEVALAPEFSESVHVLRGEFVDTARQASQVLAPEPLLRERAVPRMVRIVHLHQGADEVPAAHQLLHDGVQHPRPENRSRVVDEKPVVALHQLDVGVAGQRPERLEAVGLHPANGVVLPQPGELLVDPGLVAPVPGINETVVQRGRLGEDLYRHGNLPWFGGSSDAATPSDTLGTAILHRSRAQCTVGGYTASRSNAAAMSDFV